VCFQYACTASSAPRAAVRRGSAAQLAGVIGVAPPDAEPEDDFALLPVGQFETHLDRARRVQRRADLAGQTVRASSPPDCAACRCGR
jgi:hypothetical protein